MENNIKIVKELYSDRWEKVKNDMKESMSIGLKKWEKDVITFFPKNSRILDIGCGTGREAICLHDMGFTVTAIDISEEAIKMAKELAIETNRPIEFILTDGLSLPFNDNTFDIVIIWAQTFGLFYGAENQRSNLKECHRVLKEGGILSFSGHNKEFVELNTPPQYVDGKKLFFYTDTSCYWELFTIPEIIELAEKEGFTVLDCKSDVVFNENEKPIIHCVCRK